MRPIDADALEEIVQTDLRSNPHEDRRARAIHQAEYIHFLDIIRRAPTITPPPNDPLTPEQLRYMSGEPVWITGEKFHPRWDLIRRTTPSGMSTYTLGFLAWRDLGRTWLPCRSRK